MKDDIVSLPFLYFDANALHLYKGRPSDDSEALAKLFKRSEEGSIACITSSFTRSEMFNVKKKAAYIIQELASGRVDYPKIIEELRTLMHIGPDHLAEARKDIDDWFRLQVTAGRLQIGEPTDRAQIWRLVEVLMEHTSIVGTGDCIQMATAILLGCSHFITKDMHLHWCVTNELLADCDSRRNVQSALQQLTGVDELSIQAFGIKEALNDIEHSLAASRRTK